MRFCHHDGVVRHTSLGIIHREMATAEQGQIFGGQR